MPIPSDGFRLIWSSVVAEDGARTLHKGWVNLRIGFKKVRETKTRGKTTAPRIPAWSPTVVLTGRHPG